jgi:nucleoside-diphosphate-sugar epimerase
VNIEGTRNLLVASQASGVRKVVYTSSSAVYGAPAHNPVSETTTPSPAESYGQAKLEGEQVCNEFSAKGLDVTILRPRTIMGHGRLGIFQILFEWIRQGSNVPVLGNGGNMYQFVHAEDLAEAALRAARRPGSTSYNCGTDRFGTMRAALEHLCRHAGTKSKVKRVPMAPAVFGMRVTSAIGLSPLGPYHALMYGRSLYFDISKAQAELEWKPRFSNEDMFVDSYEWYLKHREEILKSKDGSHHRSAVKQGILKLVQWFL